jgi:ABC-type sugar transport system ATPase subunit
MKSIFTILVVLLFSSNSFAFEILALGTSNTNCKNTNAAYTNTLNDLITKHGIQARVINGGVDGDKPVFMLERMKGLVNPNTKLIIFEPGPNETNKKWNVDAVDKILEELQKKNISTIYVSHQLIESDEEAAERANRYSAYYYGRWTKGVPVDREHRQYDQPGRPGHMTAQGCILWANNMIFLIKKVINERNIQ